MHSYLYCKNDGRMGPVHPEVGKCLWEEARESDGLHMFPPGSDTILAVNETSADISLLRLLAARLERLSADSKWAHRASGLRGQVLRTLDDLDAGNGAPIKELQGVIEAAFEILRSAAREIV